MKQIKFRGKRIDNGEWVYGFYVFQPENKDHFDIHWILTGNDNLFYGSGTCRETFEKYEVDSKSVGQYTGLKDKTGKEIYEDDIVRYPADLGFNKQWDSFIGKICYNEDRPAFGVYGNDNQWVLTEAVEVIGNIYENPELL